MKTTKLLALTGSIATGKSSVAWMFKELGAPTMDCDEIAHELMKPKSHAWKAIYERFGKLVISKNDEIDRKVLGDLVFDNPADRKFLENLLHPIIKEEIHQRAAKLSKEGANLIIVEVPLLFEAHWEKEFDAVIVVTCSQENEIKRCMDKFRLAREEVIKRMQTQFPLERKKKSADFLIDNDGTLEETKVLVKRLFKSLPPLSHGRRHLS